MKKHLKLNRDYWDALTPIHAASEFYDVSGFKHGKCSLDPIEVEEVGDVSGKAQTGVGGMHRLQRRCR